MGRMDVYNPLSQLEAPVKEEGVTIVATGSLGTQLFLMRQSKRLGGLEPGCSIVGHQG